MPTVNILWTQPMRDRVITLYKLNLTQEHIAEILSHEFSDKRINTNRIAGQLKFLRRTHHELRRIP